MNRRCTGDYCLAKAGARSVSLDLPVASVLMNPRQEWSMLAHGGRSMTARELDVDWKKFNQDDFLMSHCSIVASVQVGEDGHTVLPACVELVNNNGNAWTNQVLEATFRTFVGGENYLEHCFPAGTRVLMSDGTYREIQELRSGDMVVNRLGVPDRVKNIQKRMSGNLVRISSTDILSRDLFVTSNHPFWVYHARETCPKTGRPNGFDRDRDFWNLGEWVGFSRGVHRKKGETFDCGVSPTWKNAGDLDLNRDFITHPVSDVVVENAEINKNRAELIGWFLAEGSYTYQNKFCDDESGIQFTLGNDEIDVANRLKDLLVSEFGGLLRKDCEPRIYESESGSLCLSLCNIEVARFFKKWCGKYSWAKKLCADAMWLPKDIQAIILMSYLDGDGRGEVGSRGYCVESKSQSLVHQMLFVSWRLGLSPVCRETGVLPRYAEMEIVDGYEVFVEPSTGKRSRPGYGLWFSVDDSKLLNKMLVLDDARITARMSKGTTHVFSNTDGRWIAGKIDGIVCEKVECEVFNIEVEDDNSYVVEGVVVHNCQVPELSKGRILDAVLRPVHHVDSKGRKADILFCDILVATSRKHSDLVTKIASGKLTTMSMGALADYVTCSRCGKVMGDDEKNCKHIEKQMLQEYETEDGEISVVAELCGRMTKKGGIWVADPKSQKFIEASWVEHPAFTGAVLNHYVSDISREAARILEFPTWKLAQTMDDMFRTRVADEAGMISLRVARAELSRRIREGRVGRIAGRIAGRIST